MATRTDGLPDLLPVAALLTDRRGRIVRANAAAAALLDLPRPKLAGKRLVDFLEGTGGACALVRSKEPLRRISSAVPGSSQTLVLLLGDRERSEALRARDRVLAERKLFLQSIAHDLRAPLASASGYVSLLRRNAGSVDGPDRAYFLERLEAVLNQVDEMLRHLVELNRVGAAKRASRRVPMGPLVRKVVERFAPRILELRAEVTVAPGLPDAWGDEIQLSRVFQNLVDNALKFRSARPPRIEISFEGGAFVVRDNGRGIAPALQARIWEPFVKLDPSQPGSGVGLSLTQRIVEEHGGRIRLESKAGKGAAFFVELPLAPQSLKLRGSRRR